MDDDLLTNYLVYMHFDFDGWDADKMDDCRKDGRKGVFRVERMVP